MRIVLSCIVALARVSCSSVERQRTLADIKHVGAPAHPDGSLAGAAAAHLRRRVRLRSSRGRRQAAQAPRVRDRRALRSWAVLGGVAAVGLGWYGKFLTEQAKGVLTKVGNFGEPVNGDSSPRRAPGEVTCPFRAPSSGPTCTLPQLTLTRFQALAAEYGNAIVPSGKKPAKKEKKKSG
jgi:hypothetical protein